MENIFKKNIARALARLQRLLLGYLIFDIGVQYGQGKYIQFSDALSHVCFQMSINSVESSKTHDGPKSGYKIHFVANVSRPVVMDLV